MPLEAVSAGLSCDPTWLNFVRHFPEFLQQPRTLTSSWLQQPSSLTLLLSPSLRKTDQCVSSSCQNFLTLLLLAWNLVVLHEKTSEENRISNVSTLRSVSMKNTAHLDAFEPI